MENKVDNNTVVIKMKPLCECGYIIENMNIEMKLDKHYPYDHSKYLFSYNPSHCPNCNKKIVGCIEPSIIKGRL